ncbi:hypothetical protein [Sphingosinicella soli]|uniref:Uncharacterized protein n=1 Tax=Sphingosinicella soli TaxID=333708 RepID=A0A7W7F8V4_9SPHN|nr:hypothetical protein [Sphingosinicella soli]MBB4632018.1 hypothetical protein [Sphingosinicella soli]
MIAQGNTNLFRTFFCTVGAVAVSSVLLFAAAGPARAEAPAKLAQVQMNTVSTSTPIIY